MTLEPIQSLPAKATIFVLKVVTDGKRMSGRVWEIWKPGEDRSAICEKGRGIEGEAKETYFGKRQSFDRNLPPLPSLSHLFWRRVSAPVFPGDWPAGSLFGIL